MCDFSASRDLTKRFRVRAEGLAVTRPCPTSFPAFLIHNLRTKTDSKAENAEITVK